MAEDKKLLTCAFCGTSYGPGTPSAMNPLLTEHVLVCQRHPMRLVERQRQSLRQIICDLIESHQYHPDTFEENFAGLRTELSRLVGDSNNVVTVQQAENFRLGITQ